MAIAPELASSLPDNQHRTRILQEAEFGYRYIAPYLDSLPSNAGILEVGCGSGLLMAQLAKDFSHHNYTGIEPAREEFSFFGEMMQSMTTTSQMHIFQGGYEEFTSPKKYDLIYSINVFEHLPDWQHFITFVKQNLTPAGKCVILCPNYGFPYESHFRLPILFTKKSSYRLFKKHIDNYERSLGAEGLWDSLNFIRWSQLRKELHHQNLSYIFHTTILDDMIARLDTDAEFAERQKIIALPAKFVKKTGLLRLLKLPIFWRIHPYMFIEIYQKQTN